MKSLRKKVLPSISVPTQEQIDNWEKKEKC